MGLVAARECRTGKQTRWNRYDQEINKWKSLRFDILDEEEEAQSTMRCKQHSNTMNPPERGHYLNPNLEFVAFEDSNRRCD